MRRKWFWFCVAGLLTISSAAAELKPFAELWNSLAYYDTNIERKGFSSLLGRFEGKLGFNLFDSPLQVYGVYYGTSAQSNDYWDNSIYTGAGVRLKPFEQYKGSGWTDEWIPAVKIFAEGLNANYFKGAASAEADKARSSDTRYGLDLWHEWNLDKPDESLPWGELWANLSYRDTNFGWEDFKNYIFYFQPKFGRHLGRGVEAYLRADVVASGKEGPNYYFLNVADYGVGLRFEPWRNSGANEFLQKFKMFVEVLGVSYLKDKPSSADKTVNSDVRLGIDFSIGR
jgi:hypothetical protein